MIRNITKKDKQYILKYAPDFWSEIQGEKLIGKLCIQNFSNFLDINFNSDKLIGWVYEDNNEFCGAILFFVNTDIFTSQNILKEIFWYIKPEKRKSAISYRLIKKAEEFGSQNEIQYISMMHMAYPNPEKLKNFYLKIGYHEVQSEYFKKLA